MIPQDDRIYLHLKSGDEFWIEDCEPLEFGNGDKTRPLSMREMEALVENEGLPNSREVYLRLQLLWNSDNSQRGIFSFLIRVSTKRLWNADSDMEKLVVLLEAEDHQLHQCIRADCFRRLRRFDECRSLLEGGSFDEETDKWRSKILSLCNDQDSMLKRVL